MNLIFNLPGYAEHLSEKRVQAIILFVVFALQFSFEHLFPADRMYNNGRNEIRNIFIGVGNLLLFFIPSALLVALLAIIEKKEIGLLQQFNFSFWLKVIITILLMDLFMYWWHRFNHTKKIFWRFHRFHHLDAKMNSTTALRFHSGELLFSTVFKAGFYLAAGLSFLPLLIYEILFFASIVIHHSNINISTRLDGWYRSIFSSPLMHRIHHSRVQNETDTNYGSVFSFWDRIFGSYKKLAAGEIIFGVQEGR